MNEAKDMLKLAVEIIIISALLGIAFTFTAQARQTENDSADKAADLAKLSEYREWQSCMGRRTGADMIDFIARHKYTCDIVIRKMSWNAECVPYLTDNALIMGLSDKMNIPDMFWNVEHLYYVLLDGHGDSVYEARPLYDGELAAGDGYTITGIEYTEV